MLTALSYLSIAAAFAWLAILLLPWRPWGTQDVLDVGSGGASADVGEVTVLIPARNEAEHIAGCLRSLLVQGGGLQAIVVDDHSDDGTADCAMAVSGLQLEVLRAQPLPDGWSGKLWALQQGLDQVRTRYTLLLDADIVLAPGALSDLMTVLKSRELAFASVMATLRMESVWERLLMPAFVHFFKMLYPFQLANSASRRFAAGAGGCVLAETDALRAAGGFQSIRDALIDDCALAAKFKQAGYRTWIGLSRNVVSVRRYEELGSIWQMVARTAFTQLRYSPWLLLLCTLVMLLLYWVPVWAILAPAPPQLPALIACVVMFFTYRPILRFYGLNTSWGFAQPVVALLYLAMTWSSAIRYWRGQRSQWKGRVYR